MSEENDEEGDKEDQVNSRLAEWMRGEKTYSH